ncbi:hypothetical protein WT72_21910 [Burkholderia pseudomultivorans]|uniref:Uncharacterized protein n=1 Tax=Burkholderia pseudomultivorans TaxID=1207504 RepID=A0A132F248_9BURK|nr:hypothetical protein WT57_16055 [Burkholderia pseudomultivorans]KWI52137.1 hypothetical protein WT72_21910 [Burkholderia pseudomultivorans]
MHRFATPPGDGRDAGRRVHRPRRALPAIRIANPEFRIGAGRCRICAHEIDAKDTFGSLDARLRSPPP